MTAAGNIRAPWTPEQVALLEAWQARDCHAYTCPRRGSFEHAMAAAVAEDWDDRGVLTPTKAGWLCMACGYRQDWCPWGKPGTPSDKEFDEEGYWADMGVEPGGG